RVFTARVLAWIDNGDCFCRPRSVMFFRRTFARFQARHERHNAFPIRAATFWTKLFLKHWQDRPVELLRFRDAHPMDFESNNGESRSGKYFNDATRPQVWKPEVVGLNQDERLLDLRVGGERDRAIQNSAVGIRKFRPEFQIPLYRGWIESCQYSRFKVSHLP